jgi:predicted TIM-barrel fold metal-dependent hydrolase
MIGSDVPENLEIEFSKILGLDLPPEAKQDVLWNTAARVFDNRG